jgi:hypothetical protein
MYVSVCVIRNVKINHKKQTVPYHVEIMEFFDGLKLWNVYVEFYAVSDNGTSSVSVMCFSELQLRTFYDLNNNWDEGILRINFWFFSN